MALLDLVQRVCDEVGLPRPVTVASSTDQLARQLYSLANAELEELSKRFDWPVLTREYNFPTVAGTPQYALPNDYRKFLAETIYDSSRYYKMRGSLSAGEWQRVKALNMGSLSCARVRIYGNPLKLNVLPTPVSVEAVVFEYMSKNFAVNGAGAEQLRFSNDSDTSLVDEGLVRMGLKWRIKHAKGLEFSADLAEYEAVVAREFAAALAQPSIPVGFSRHEDAPVTSGTIPSSGFGA
jgi:hypothetical protein